MSVFFLWIKPPARLNHYQWVGPLVEAGWCFFTTPDSNITIKSFNNIENYTITGAAAVASVEKFARSSMAPIITANSDEGALTLLYRGRADLLLTGIIEVKPTARELGYKELRLAYLWKKLELALDCSN